MNRPIFVFGSNLAGRHGAGAALTARKEYGAVYGVGEGKTGHAYAIPTKDENIQTRIGYRLAGYTDEQIAPFFKDVPQNCILPLGWSNIL